MFHTVASRLSSELNRLQRTVSVAAAGLLALAATQGVTASAQNYVPPVSTTVVTSLLSSSAADQVAVDRAGNVYYINHSSPYSLIEIPAQTTTGVATSPVTLITGIGQYNADSAFVDSKGNLWVSNGNGTATVGGNAEYIGFVEVPAGANGLPNVSTLGPTVTVAQVAATNCTSTTAVPCVWQANSYASSVTSYYSQPSAFTVSSAGIVYFIDYNSKKIISFNPASSPNTGTLLATAPTANNQASVALDGAGNLYYCDDSSSNYGAGGTGKLSLVASSTLTTVGTTATNGTAVISSCIGVAADKFGNLFVSGTNPSGAQQLSEIPFEGTALNFSDEFVVTATTAGSASGSVTGLPASAAFAYAGNLDQYGNYFYSTSSGVNEIQINSYNFGNAAVGSYTTASTTPASPTLDLYVNTASSSISSYFPTGSPTTNTTAAYLQSFPWSGTKSLGGGSPYVANNVYSAIMNFEPTHPGRLLGSYTPRNNGVDVTTVNLQGVGTGPLALNFTSPTATQLFTQAATTTSAGAPTKTLNAPQGLAVDSFGDIFVADTGNGKVVADCLSTTTANEDGASGAANTFCASAGYTNNISELGTGFVSPVAIALDGAQSLYVVDSSASGTPVTYINGQNLASSAIASATTKFGGTALSGPMGIAVDGYSNVYIADTGNNRIVEAHQFGAQPASSVIATDDIVLVPSTTTFGGTALSGPQGLALDSAYDLFIADTGNNRIVEYSATGAASVVGTGSVTLSAPYAVTVYPSGALVVADANAVYLINGSNSAKLTFPTYATAGAKGVALGQFGDIFVSNTAGNQVLELNTSATPTLSFPATNGGSSSTDVTLVVSNEGNTALTDSAVATSTANFSIDTANNTCTATASTAAGSSCNLVLQFTPQGTSTGTETGTATITDNQLSVASLVTSTSNETATFTTSGAYTVNLTGTATVAGQPQTITFPAFSPSTVQYATTPIALTATDNSGLPITYTVTSGPGSITGTASAPTLTITGIGTITVQATQTGGVNGQGTAYAAATPQSQSLTVTQASQTITFTPASPITYGGASNTIDLSKVASATSGLPVSFSVTSGPGTISGTTLTVTNAGTIVIAANQAGNTDYSAAPTVTAQIVVNPVGTLPAPVQTDGFSYTTGGLYNSKFLPMPVTLSDATSGTSIYYTTDGSTPSPNSGTTQLYKSTTGLPTISATTTLKAIAVETGYTNSSVTTITYTVDSNPETLQLALSATSLSLGLGQSGTITITVTPQHGLISALQYSCMGVPAGGTCTFTPATANAVPLQTPVTLTMTVTAPTTMAMLEQRGRSLLPETTFALCLCLFGWRRRRNVRIALMLLVATIGLTWISGCGSGGTSSENWPLTVAIGADTVRTTANVALTIHK
jgi:sugar lactone lactonase YvrE